MHPDLDRVTVLAAQPGWAWAPLDRYDRDGVAHPNDHRLVLRREVDRLAALGLTAKAGFEIEWMVSHGVENDDYHPAGPAGAYSWARQTEMSDYLRDVLAALAAQGVDVEQIHPEYTPGQFEVSYTPRDPLDAADTCVLVRHTIRGIGLRHGLRTTFAPKVFTGGVGNGGHVHLSLWRGEADVMESLGEDGGEGGEGESFAAGILERLPALLAIGVPSVVGYLRLVPQHWAGAYACWGVENREAAMRYVPGALGERHRAANVEVKCFDATASPYLLLAGLLAAGRAGLRDGARLPAPVESDPAMLDNGPAPLPVTLGAATDAFEAEGWLRAELGEGLADTVADVRRAEIALFAGADEEHVVAYSRWRH